jgi:hypothetical protein
MIHAFSGHIFRRIDAAIIAQMVFLRLQVFPGPAVKRRPSHGGQPTICAVMTASAAI